MPTTVAYGDHPSQIAHLWEPQGGAPAPVAALLHGGWWRDGFGAGLMDPLARDLAAAGWAVWNVEYRRTGGGGGGWPQTLDDVDRALGVLAEAAAREPGRYDLTRTVSVGHSAGGHLALLNALHPRTPVRAVVALAPITDVERCAREGLGEGAVEPFLGSDPSARVYAASSPLLRVPLGVPQLVVHGDADQRVPVSHSRGYVTAARAAGDTVDHHEPSGADHFAVIDPAHPAWLRVRAYLADRR
ncbi:alpha/beta hydrolase family protein [Nocardiopsis alborubida]|uniref:Prolyl oligopeptidase family serine peptidase n=1 Tax=Nocardiopsis alborubida TaxID=146802 RepID=A0A7X6MBF3_9ACTN|nr:prolyl oligopeptidase family serine peptidase [Nocardiopsis alborubida]NKY98166.1 prolyl oligopeptidase family serine peptidase [Nocardiopsis alborubida]